MRSVRSMAVTQFRIFPPDLIPFLMIVTPSAANIIQQVMGFRSVGRNAEIAEVIFQEGSFKISDDKPTIVVTEMRINERRVIIQVEGNSGTANQAYSLLREICSRFGDRFRDAEPTLLTEETKSVVELEFDWSSLLNPALVAVANDFAAGHAGSLVQQYIKSVSVQVVIGTRIAEELTEAGIVATDKPLVIEPRTDVPLSERVYFTRSPSDSETHLALIRDLEARLIKRAAEKRR